MYNNCLLLFHLNFKGKQTQKKMTDNMWFKRLPSRKNSINQDKVFFFFLIIQSQAAFVNYLYVARFTIIHSKTQIKCPLLAEIPHA